MSRKSRPTSRQRRQARYSLEAKLSVNRTTSDERSTNRASAKPSLAAVISFVASLLPLAIALIRAFTS